MGATPRDKDKPRPSYETEASRNQAIAESQGEGSNPSDLNVPIQRATKTSDATDGHADRQP